ncbi:hypothetical protein [Citricoccus sp.]|uniref:hypothetical protein n=1 Tax=Citricoccus sp. TaxID=1978372 RepID=UPI0028BDD2F2|nr:hypothetical protein [Citricoccus sp.]
MMTSTADRTFRAGRCVRAGSRRGRLAAAVGLGISAGLVLSACGTGDEPSGSPTATTDPNSSPVETMTETASPGDSATANATLTETASASPTVSGSGEQTTGLTQSYTSESGVFTWSFPETWSASQEDYSEEFLDYLGVPYEVVLFQNPEDTVEYRTTTGIAPTDNEGPKLDVVEVLEAEVLPDVPEATGSGPVWYRASLYRASEDWPDPQSFEGGEFLLSVQVVNVAEDLDPEATDDSFWSSWIYAQPSVQGDGEGTATLLSGSVTQDTAEEVTGLEGEEAMRAFLETEEYGQLRSVATSMEVEVP